MTKINILVVMVLLCAILTGFQRNDTIPTYNVTVSAGDFDRNGTVVSFSMPADFEKGVYQMQSGNNEPVVVQIDRNNKAWFTLENLPAGSTRNYTFFAERINNEASNIAGVNKHIGERTISLYSDGKHVLDYYHSDNELPEGMDAMYQRGGYIHPVYSPSGVMLTTHLNPVQHAHHMGIWSAWTNTVFQGRTPDFWNVQNKTGKVDQADSLEEAWQGPVHGGFRSRHYFMDLLASAPVIALNEQWEVYAYHTDGNSGVLIFDLVVTQTANTALPLHLPEYRYGGIGFRGHNDWDDPDKSFYLTSEGLGRLEGHGTRARWCHIGGYSEGDLAGIAVLDHPENYGFPQPMRIHPNEPFFNFTPVQLGDMTIEPGSPYVVRYRFVTYDGEPDPVKLDRLWNDYAWPPGVTVSQL